MLLAAFPLLRLPYLCHHHPSAHRLLADLDAVPLRQLLAGERRSEVVPLRLLQQLHDTRLRLLVDPPVRRPAPQSVHDNRVAIGLHARQQFSHPPAADAHLRGGVLLRDDTVLHPLQPLQPISFLLVHPDSFHPPSFLLSRGTFYFALLGTSHFAATAAGKSKPERPSSDTLIVP